VAEVMPASEHRHKWVPIGRSGSELFQCACEASRGLAHDFISMTAAEARQIAGPSYYTGCWTHRDSNTLELWLANAPAEVLTELEELHPGTYVIHNDAPRSETDLFGPMEILGAERWTLRSEGIHVVGVGPTHDGYLHVRVMGDVPTAQARLDAMLGRNVARVEYGEPLIACASTAPDARLARVAE
jgi:hypothetical protein